MSSFTLNQHSVIPPPGSIMPYIGGGTTTSGVNPGDPDGWVICDGQLRTATDNRFTNLYLILNTYMGVSSNTANSITPPNLFMVKFLRLSRHTAMQVLLVLLLLQVIYRVIIFQ